MTDKCALCNVSFMPAEIPIKGLCNDEQYHQECYRQHYAAIEYEPEECVQRRHRE